MSADAADVVEPVAFVDLADIADSADIDLNSVASLEEALVAIGFVASWSDYAVAVLQIAVAAAVL